MNPSIDDILHAIKSAHAHNVFVFPNNGNVILAAQQAADLAENVDVHPLLVVAALLGGGVLGGIAGMLVAVPTAALLKLQFDRFLQKLENGENVV